MAPTASLIKENWGLNSGLDRDFGVELYYVSGITGWTPQNTTTTVFSALPVAKGSAHPDPNIRAICTNIRVVKGPSFVGGLDNGKAIVAVTYDSERRWGAASFIQGTKTNVSDERIMVPNWTKITTTTGGSTTDNWLNSPIPYIRGTIMRIENRFAVFTNYSQLEAAKNLVYGYVGQAFSIFGVPYLMLSPDVIRLPTNQTIFQYRFLTKTPVPGRTPDANTVGVSVPSLGYLEEWVETIGPDGTPIIGKRTVSDYINLGNTIGDPTVLPYWSNTL